MLLSGFLAKKRIRLLSPGRDESSLTSARMVFGFGDWEVMKMQSRRFRRKFIAGRDLDHNCRLFTDQASMLGMVRQMAGQ